MVKKKLAEKQAKYNLMVLNAIKELSKVPNARLSIREISRTIEINPMAVSRSIKQLEPILDIKNGSDFENFRLQLKLVRLKEGFENLEIDELMKKIKLSKKFMNEFY
jgi:hypothetical protein